MRIKRTLSSAYEIFSFAAPAKSLGLGTVPGTPSLFDASVNLGSEAGYGPEHY